MRPTFRKLVFSSSELLEPHLSRSWAVIIQLPIEEGRLADPGLPANLRHQHPIVSGLRISCPLKPRHAFGDQIDLLFAIASIGPKWRSFAREDY